jgi:iron complex outermembrane recepter protein
MSKFKPLAIATLLYAHPILANDSAEELDSIIVVGQSDTTQADSSRAGSLDVISRTELQGERVDDTSELFNKVPGLYIARYNQGIVNSDIAIRGFAGDGETPHAKLLIDGIPANLHNGFSEMDQLFPMAIESIEVYKSTSDARVGLFNIAGNYQIRTRQDVAQEIQLSLGSFNARELQGYAGFETGDLTHSYFIGYRDSEGYRDRTNLEKLAGAARFGYALSDATKISANIRHSTYDADSAGYLSRQQARTNPRSSASFADQDGGDKSLNHVSAGVEHMFSDAWNVGLTLYQQDFERQRWVRFSQAAALQNRFDDQQHRGWIANSFWQMNEQWALELGLDGEQQDVIEQRFGTLGQARIRNTANVLRNRDFEFDSTGGFVQLSHAPNSQWRWNLGVRVDRLDGDYVQLAANGTPSARQIFDFGNIVQPKLNLFYSPNEQLTLFGNLGRGFQHPLSADLYTTGDRRARDVSYNDGGELGLMWNATDNVDLRLSYWQQKAKDEFVVVDGTAQNVGETERQGFDLGWNWNLSEAIYLWGNLSHINTEITSPASSARAFIGNELRSVPDLTGSLGMSYRLTEALSLKLHVDGQSDYFVNEANVGGEYGDFLLVHANVDYQTRIGEFGLQLNNILDAEYEYVFDFSPNGTDTIHSPGDGVAASLSYRYRF